MKVPIPYLSILGLTILLSHRGMAGTLYYDTNGSTGGTETSSTQDFTDSVWTIDPTGAGTTTGYTAGSDVIFSATDGINVGTGTQNVTVTDAESVDGFTFDNGTVTLNGSGAPNLSIAAGGITVNSADGATTFDSSLGTLTLSGSQEWNNDSSQGLNVNSNVTASGATLSFAGDGTGNVNLNGQLSGNLNLTADSTTSALYLNNNGNNFTGTITADGGSVVIGAGGAFGNGSNTVDLNNDGTLEFTSGMSPNTNIVVGPGGGQIDAGVYGVSGYDIFYGGAITGSAPGSVLNIIGGDFIPTSNTATSNIGTINVTGGRLLAYGSGIFTGNAAFNVSSGATLDTAVGGSLGNTITLASGSALENRSGGVSFPDVIFPTGTATVTLGTDDVGGGSLAVAGPDINLASGTTLTIVSNAKEYYSEFTSTDQDPSDPSIFNAVFQNWGPSTTAIHLEEKITGSGDLVLTSETAPIINYFTNDVVGTRQGSGSPVYLDGANDYSGATTINGVIVYPGTSGFGSSTVILNSGNGRPYFDNTATIELTGGNLANHFIANSGRSVLNMAGNVDQTISGPIELSTSGATIYVTNYGAGNLTFGNITYDSANNDYMSFDAANGGGSITLTGTYNTPVNSTETMVFGANDYQGSEQYANYYLGPNADFTNFQQGILGGGATINLDAGNLYIETSKFGFNNYIAVGSNAGDNHTINIVGSQTIDAQWYSNEAYGPAEFGQWTINQSTANESTLAGVVIQGSTGLIVSSVAGGRLVFTNNISGGSPVGAVKTGAGVVVFDNPNGNDYQLDGQGYSYGVTSTVAMDIQQGTLIVNSAQGYGLGNNSGMVKIEAGATLGGSTTLHPGQQVVAEDATSVIAPGDPGDAKYGIAPEIGTLSLQGTVGTDSTPAVNALTAPNGLTLDFKLNGLGGGLMNVPNIPGTGNDFLEIGPGGMDLEGNITINLTVVGDAPLLTGTGNYYILIQGSGNLGDWTGNPTFTVNAPTGYALDPTFGPDDGLGDGKDLGYIYDTVGDTFYVQLIATPEPSTYGLLGLGLLAIVAVGRIARRKAADDRAAVLASCTRI
jgi:hypothetical protein